MTKVCVVFKKTDDAPSETIYLDDAVIRYKGEMILIDDRVECMRYTYPVSRVQEITEDLPWYKRILP